MLPVAVTSRTISHHPDLNTLIPWSQNVLLSRLLPSYQMTIPPALQPSCAHWQLDVRRLNNYAWQLGQWTTATYYLIALPLLLAFLAFCSIYERLLANIQWQEYVQHSLATAQPVTTGNFIDEALATQRL
ncbi:hypothetical protein [Hymenobacter wooponensis]|uniref:Uncharacterized protein n=1 Tax=Hymenobacter wooponensis TaxID=1525360 RepID=A0A4Z0MRX2_9BACT|nr:hypothetical protein [Hymenobacter wooponensis]TGD82563.1 hypothetical protein EU557_01900 [Hymenobacter wooponensis]